MLHNPGVMEMFMMFQPGKCPVCGSFGDEWEHDADVLKCKKCEAVFSEFGVVNQPQKIEELVWN